MAGAGRPPLDPGCRSWPGPRGPVSRRPRLVAPPPRAERSGSPRPRGPDGLRLLAPLAWGWAGRWGRSGCGRLSSIGRMVPEPDLARTSGPGTTKRRLDGRRFVKSLGGDLLSHPASRAVPSALEGLTSGFGMGPGVSPPLWPPKRSGASGTPETSRTTQRARATEVSCQVLGLLVPVSSTHCCASTSGLSTRSSSRGPYQVDPVGDLILERASRLYAFSAYPFRTWPMSSAVGTTTHTPEVRPSRSSRTRDSSPQISYAHGG